MPIDEQNSRPTDPQGENQLADWRAARGLPPPTPAWHWPVMLVCKGLVLVSLLFLMLWLLFLLPLFVAFGGFVVPLSFVACLLTLIIYTAWSMIASFWRR
jgi:hypothetical protein